MIRSPDILDVSAAPSPSSPAMPGMCGSGGCGCAPPSPPPPPTFGDVRVNGVEIPPEAIARELQNHPAPDPETAWTEAARALVVRELLLQEAARLDLRAAPEDAGEGDGGAETEAEDEEEMLIRMVLEQCVVPEHPGEQECRRYYEANLQRFRTPDLFDAAHILIEPESDGDAAWQEAETRARTIAAKIGNDPHAFAEAARAHSGCASSIQDGSLGQIRRGELVAAVQDGLERLADGETGQEPVRSRYGWHVLRLHRRTPGHVMPFEVVGGKIADMLEARSWSVGATRYVAGLARRGQVEGVLVEQP